MIMRSNCDHLRWILMFSSNKNLESIIVMILSMAMFTCGDAIIKYLSADLPLGEIIFVRGIMVCLLFTLLLKFQKQEIFPKQGWNRWNLIRAFFELAVACFYLVGLMLLPLATAVILVFSGPIILTVLAALILKEKVGWRRWCAVFVGFIGVIFVADINLDSNEIVDSWALLLPLTAALLTALRDVFVRNIPSALSPTQIAFTTAWMVTLGGLLTLPLGWQPITADNMTWLGIASAVILGAYLSYVYATRHSELSLVAPFKYSSIPLAMLLGFFIWGDVPTQNDYIGTMIIMGAGIFIFIRKQSKESKENIAKESSQPAQTD